MLVFSNVRETTIVKYAAILSAIACSLPLGHFLFGGGTFRDLAGGLSFFSFWAVLSLLFYRHTCVEVRVGSNSIRFIYPILQKEVDIPYEQIDRMEYSELSFALLIWLKDKKRFKIGSSVVRVDGEFSVPELSKAYPHGDAGEKIRLMNEISQLCPQAIIK